MSAWFAISTVAAAGPFAMVLVGATIVGSMETVWHGVVNPPAAGPGKPQVALRTTGASNCQRGAEMGRFKLGSTVVLLFPARIALRFDATWMQHGALVRMGQAMAQRG